MLEAKSMYLGGDIVSAKECNYDSYLKLGLKCPFCNNAVFLRSASQRITKDSVIPIVAYFAHFPSGLVDNDECEARSKSGKGKQEIEEIKIEARNQRLKIYNTKLWELMLPELKVTKQDIIAIRKNIGERSLDKCTKAVGMEIIKSFDRLQAEAQSIAESLATRDRSFLYTLENLDEQSRAIAIKHSQYLGECDIRLHLSICLEVLNFLSTSSGKWTLNKLVAIAVNSLQGYIQPTPYHDLVSIETLPTYQIAEYILYPVMATSWAKEIGKLDKKF